MRADLGVRLQLERALQHLGRAGRVAHPVLHPAEAVHDVRVVRRERQCLVDQLAGLRQALIAIGQRIAERVVRLRVVGLRADQLAQLLFHRRVVTGFFGRHRVVVAQVGIVREVLDRLAEPRLGFRKALRGEQDRRVGARDHGRIAWIADRQVVEHLAGLVGLALFLQQLRARDLRRQVVLARLVDLVEPLRRLRVVALLDRDLREVDVALADVEVRLLVAELHVLFQVRARVVELLLLDLDQRERHQRRRIFRVELAHRLELFLRVVEAVVGEIELRQRKPPVARLRILLNIFLERRDAGRALRGAHLRQHQRRRQVVRTDLQCLLQRARRAFLVVDRQLLPRDRELRLGAVHVVLQHVLQHREAGDAVGAAHQQRLQREDRGAARFAGRAGQLAREQRLRVGRLAGEHQQCGVDLRCAVRIGRVLAPQIGRGQRVGRALRAQCDLGRTLRHARIARVAGEGEVGLVSRRRLVALERNFGGQHLVDDLARQRDAGEILLLIRHHMLERALRLRVVRCRILRVSREGGEGPGGEQRGAERTADREGARAVLGGGALQKQLRGQSHGNPFDVSTDCNALATIHARS
ncbi:hypothetical protein BamIOP4010DRAFT_3457 [Burkholderia ambifaria IOP40-10]|uniref:Uncharacterized protein n=1 Tax=Burkholderia ambifaria IOP40-10 TaxID=396596 RepID=B1FHE7_9BURK|nr:hypothetical protein BamIOP4010DRAFT_3457 [Burkholderia ambifaria IOP40-10]